MGEEEIGTAYPHHHPQFDFDERAMLVGGKLLLGPVIYINKKQQ